MKEWSLPDITKTNEKMSKNEWENIVKKEAKLQNTKLLYNMIKNYSKLDIMKKEAYEVKPYIEEMKMHDARMNFSLRSRMC